MEYLHLDRTGEYVRTDDGSQATHVLLTRDEAVRLASEAFSLIEERIRSMDESIKSVEETMELMDRLGA